MKVQIKWNEKLKFTAEADQHSVEMDTKSPLGSDSALSPKQLLLAAICGCTGMDVVSLLKKNRQPIDSFQLDAEASLTEKGYPTVFKEVRLVLRLKGAIDPAKALEAVTLSQTKYCSVSAMMSKAAPIYYTVELNGQAIGTGQARFE